VREGKEQQKEKPQRIRNIEHVKEITHRKRGLNVLLTFPLIGEQVSEQVNE